MSWTDADIATWSDADIAPPVNPGAWEQAGTRLGEVGRVFTKALASPFTLSARAWNKLGLPQNDLEARVDELTGRMATPPTSTAGKIVEGVAEAAPALALPGGWMSQVLGNAAVGAVQAEPGQELKDAAIGGGLGAVGKVFTKALTRPVTPSKEAEKLMARGIQPTVGQGAESSAIHAAEDLAAGLPIVGHAVRSGQKRAIGEFQQDVFKGALDASDEALNKFAKMNPRAQVEWVESVLKPRYDDLLDGMPPVNIPSGTLSELSKTSNKLPMDVRREYDRIMLAHLADENGNALTRPLTGREVKSLTSELGTLTSDLLDSGTAMEKRAARVIGEQRGRLKNLMPPEMQAVDDAYSKFLRLQEASYRTLKPAEGITPAAYQQAVKQTSIGNQFAKGEAVGQDLSDPAQILRNSPNGGMSMLAAGGVAGLSHLTGMNIPAIVAAVTAALGSTRTGAKVAFGNTDFQKSMANLMRESNPITKAPLPFSASLIRARAARTAPALAMQEEERNRRKPLNQY